MNDTIVLRGLRVRGHHGVHDHERRDGQLFVVDAVLSVDTGPAALTDELARTVDYSRLARGLADDVAGNPVDLIETLAERLAALCLAEPGVHAVELTVHKPEAPVGVPVDDIAVTVRRGRPAQP